MTFERLKQRCTNDWSAYCEHEFVRRLGDGTLPAMAFRHYLQQDYKFLIHFARAWGLAAYKARDLDDVRHALASLKTIVDVELGLHVQYCEAWGISAADLDALPEAHATMAYTRYVLDSGNRGDVLDLRVALAPCLIGYAEIGRWLERQDFGDQRNNPYGAWTKMYAGDAFQAAAAQEAAWLDDRLAQVSAARFDQLAGTFRDATRLEIDFWQMGLAHDLAGQT